MQNGQIGLKFKNAKSVQKYDSTTTLEWLCAKNCVKTHLIVKKGEHFENGQNWPKGWAIAQANWSVWVKNQKCQKSAKNDCKTSLELLCAKNRVKKDLIFEKREHIENGQKHGL